MSRVGKIIFGAQEKLRRMTQDEPAKAAAPGAVYAFEAKLNDGTVRRLSDYKGQVLLIVNTASRCGFTPQYEGLEALHKKYKDQGLRVLGFPSNDFGAQEPGSDADIKGFCSLNFGVTFDLFSKVAVKGAAQHPLYKFLTTESGHNGAIAWNFAKFLVDREGKVVERFGPDTEPGSARLVQWIEGLLAKKGE